MPSVTRRLCALVLLAVYGGVTFLGQGLHWLSPHDHHHHGLLVAHHDGVGCGHHHHHCGHDHSHSACHEEQERSREPCCASSDVVAHTHDCDICEFLAQARGQAPHATVAIVSAPLVFALLTRSVESDSPNLLGPQAPRGPPGCPA